MKLKMNFKILLVFGIIFVSFLLFNTNEVNAVEISDYKCKIEKDGFIFYNNYFNTEDVIYGGESFIHKYNVDKTTFNKILNEWKEQNDFLILIEVTNDTESVTYDNNKLEIIELNNKRYAVVNYDFPVEYTDTMLELYIHHKLNITKNEITETKDITYHFWIYNVDYFSCEVRIVNENGVIYENSYNTNGIVNGMGFSPLPSKLDIDKAYVEYLTNVYIGETLKIDSLGNVPYVGKYGNQYKYRTSLKNAKIDDSGAFRLCEFSYKGSFAVGDFWLDPNYTIDNETYVSNKQTNTNTKLKFDLRGNFKGTLKAEEISKNDLIYNKVDEELKKNIKDYLFMDISNIYIENGSYEGPLKLTFYVGEQYNGKYYSIVHMKNYLYEFERFEGIVKNGIIEITVDSLSPFGISIYEELKEENTDNNNDNNTNVETAPPTQNEEPTNKGEKDETPKTGRVDIIGYVSIITLISFVGIVALKKKLK